MTDHTPAAQAAGINPLSDEYVNAVIQQHGYQSPETVIARLSQWIGLHGGENGVTLLMYEAHKALVKLRAPVADDQWPTLSDLHLQALVFAYNEGYSKAVDGRKFKNPFSSEGSQGAAWQLGTDDGTEAREKMASAPVAGEAVADLIEDLSDLASDMAYEANQEMDQEKATRAALIERGERALRRFADAAPQASEAVRDTALTALQAARQFISNGIELGFIRMPDADVPDPAHRTPGLIDAAIRALSAQPGAQKEQSDA